MPVSSGPVGKVAAVLMDVLAHVIILGVPSVNYYLLARFMVEYKYAYYLTVQSTFSLRT